MYREALVGVRRSDYFVDLTQPEFDWVCANMKVTATAVGDLVI